MYHHETIRGEETYEILVFKSLIVFVLINVLSNILINFYLNNGRMKESTLTVIRG